MLPPDRKLVQLKHVLTETYREEESPPLRPSIVTVQTVDGLLGLFVHALRVSMLPSEVMFVQSNLHPVITEPPREEESPPHSTRLVPVVAVHGALGQLIHALRVSMLPPDRQLVQIYLPPVRTETYREEEHPPLRPSIVTVQTVDGLLGVLEHALRVSMLPSEIMFVQLSLHPVITEPPREEESPPPSTRLVPVVAVHGALGRLIHALRVSMLPPDRQLVQIYLDTVRTEPYREEENPPPGPSIVTVQTVDGLLGVLEHALRVSMLPSEIMFVQSNLHPVITEPPREEESPPPSTRLVPVVAVHGALGRLIHALRVSMLPPDRQLAQIYLDTVRTEPYREEENPPPGPSIVTVQTVDGLLGVLEHALRVSMLPSEVMFVQLSLHPVITEPPREEESPPPSTRLVPVVAVHGALGQLIHALRVSMLPPDRQLVQIYLPPVITEPYREEEHPPLRPSIVTVQTVDGLLGVLEHALRVSMLPSEVMFVQLSLHPVITEPPREEESPPPSTRLVPVVAVHGALGVLIHALRVIVTVQTVDGLLGVLEHATGQHVAIGQTTCSNRPTNSGTVSTTPSTVKHRSGGVFSTRLNHNKDFKSPHVGFRCIYQPPTN